MRAEILLTAALATAVSPNVPGCHDFSGDLCVDGGDAQRGLIVMRDSSIEFEDAGNALKLTVRDRGSGSVTELELPKSSKPLSPESS